MKDETQVEEQADVLDRLEHDQSWRIICGIATISRVPVQCSSDSSNFDVRLEHLFPAAKFLDSSRCRPENVMCKSSYRIQDV